MNNVENEENSILTNNINIPTLENDFNYSLFSLNLEDFHGTLLSAAQAEHTKVRERALRLLELDRIRCEREALKEAADAAEERVRIESEKVREECRIREAEKKVREISKPTILPPLEPHVATSSTVESQPVQPTITFPSFPIKAASQDAALAQKPQPLVESKRDNITELATTKRPLVPSSVTVSTSTALPTIKPYQAGAKLVSNTKEQSIVTPQPTTFGSSTVATGKLDQVGRFSISQPSAPAKALNQSTAQRSKFHQQTQNFVNTTRYREIHAEMKRLRKLVESQVDPDANSMKLKNICSEGRREITKALGQLVVGGNNSTIVILKLREALKTNYQLISVSLFTVKNHEAVSGAPLTEDGVDMNSDKLPIIFIYLIGSLCKSICAQLVSEAAVKPLAATPIGILTAKIFSDPRLHWRGKSLIDVLISKIFIACPILFGVSGDDSTEEGRVRIGWRKINGRFISEQAHYDRMSGIAAGYAAISLRDFSRTKWTNPYPPVNYWFALSAVVSTPDRVNSPSRFVVLKSLVEHSFPRFIQFYGDMAIAALHAALVEFPKRGAESNPAVGTLKALGTTLLRDHGLRL
ncbi:nucleoporin [Blumeria hordei DH14]|uniref:mRNA export factor GLE1 n=1 Tax=Blumeria graminis f. sp. hordei (strain DH14) TaxID=546991 RepID=N1JI54_BLUG1|nr:nucleoporin [Blumeria hordei DH14]